MRLDEDKLEALRSWGERLSQGGGEEAAAVGRAILMLAEEIDRLHIELWHARLQEGGAEPVATDATIEEDEAPVASSLHVRLQRVLRRDPGPSTTQPEETTASDAESERTTTAQDWIDALRRQK
jgi:hypothetical protein